MSTNASRTARNQHNLLIPIIAIFAPIIQAARIQIPAHPSYQPKIKQSPNARIGCFVQDREIGSFLCVAGCEEEEEREGGVEGCFLKEASDGVCC